MVGKQEHEFVLLTQGTIRLDSRFRGNDGKGHWSDGGVGVLMYISPLFQFGNRWRFAFAALPRDAFFFIGSDCGRKVTRFRDMPFFTSIRK